MVVGAELAGLIADGPPGAPIVNVYPSVHARRACAEFERRHIYGKIILRP